MSPQPFSVCCVSVRYSLTSKDVFLNDVSFPYPYRNHAFVLDQANPGGSVSDGKPGDDRPSVSAL